MQHNVIPLTRPQEFLMEAAYVKGGDSGGYMVENSKGIFKAKKAFSCLVEPQPGDKILLAISDVDCRILSVLEREDSRMVLDFPGKVELKADKGGLDLTCKESVNLTSGKKLAFRSPELLLTGVKSSMVADELQVQSRNIQCRGRSVSFFAESIDCVVNRITQSAKNIMRRVEGVETANIGNLIQTVRNTFTQHAHNTVITAKKDIKIDGERIHMG